jgi:hypothetical protein
VPFLLEKIEEAAADVVGRCHGAQIWELLHCGKNEPPLAITNGETA